MKCIIDGCDNEAVAHGLCHACLKQLKRKGFIEKKPRYTGCKICGPDAKHFSHGFCAKHYKQFVRGKIDEEGNPVKN